MLVPMPKEIRRKLKNCSNSVHELQPGAPFQNIFCYYERPQKVIQTSTIGETATRSNTPEIRFVCAWYACATGPLFARYFQDDVFKDSFRIIRD